MLNNLLQNGEIRNKSTNNMLNMTSKFVLDIFLLDVSRLKQHLPSEIRLLLENNLVLSFSSMVRITTMKLSKSFSSDYRNSNVFCEEGSNNFGAVLVVVHCYISALRVEAFPNLPNVIVLVIGKSPNKFQLATCYSPLNENLPTALFDIIIDRNKDTILLRDFNTKHQT